MWHAGQTSTYSRPVSNDINPRTFDEKCRNFVFRDNNGNCAKSPRVLTLRTLLNQKRHQAEESKNRLPQKALELNDYNCETSSGVHDLFETSVFDDDDDSESEVESIFESSNTEIRHSIMNLKKGQKYINQMMESTINTLKSHQKPKNIPEHKPEATKYSKKPNDNGGEKKSDNFETGDIRHSARLQSDCYIKMVTRKKADCYQQILKQLQMLKGFDAITDKLIQNHIDD